MRTYEKERVIKETIYVAKDGKEFRNKEACRAYEEELDGIRKRCDNCYGTGRINHRVESIRNELTCKMEDIELSDTCPVCSGKGYLRKEIVWK